MSQAAAKTVLQNIFTYATIVAQAETPAVASWDRESVIKALQWASYCKELAARVHGRRLAVMLEERLEEMSQLIDSHFLYKLDLQFLARSLDILVEVLVHNPHLPPHLILTVRQHIETHYSTHVSALQKGLAAAKSELQFSAVVAEHLKFFEDRTRRSKVLLDDPAVKDHGRLLMENLTLWLEACYGSGRFEKQVAKITKRLSQIPSGWDILLTCVSVDINKVEEAKRDSLAHVINLIINWVMEENRIYGLACPVWRVDPLLMVNTAKSCSRFCDFYLSALEMHMESLEVIYMSQNISLKQPKESFYLLRSSEHPDIPVYAQLCKHFEQLLLTKDTVMKSKALAVVSSKAKGCVFSAWTDLAKDLVKHLTCA